MTRICLWTACAVAAVVGSYRWYVKIYPPENMPIRFRYVTVTNYVTERRYVDVELPRHAEDPNPNRTPRYDIIYITNASATNVTMHIPFVDNTIMSTNTYYVTNFYVTNAWRHP